MRPLLIVLFVLSLFQENIAQADTILTRNNTGHITSPGFDGLNLYASNLEQSVHIELENERVLLNLTFHHFELGEEGDEGNCTADYLQIQNGSGSVLHELCGSQPFPDLGRSWIQLLASELRISFVTDDEDEYTGYSMSWSPVDLDDCATSPCNNGICLDGVNSYTCECQLGFEGDVCNINIDECESSPCLNGICLDGNNSYTCECSSGYEGETCDTNIDNCATSPCNNGACADGLNTYTCECLPGYGGSTCNEDVDECASNPCNNGDCHDGLNSYSCECSPGYEGATCNSDIDDCEMSPCSNGICRDLVDSYFCECFPGFQGETCATEINECVNSPCLNGTCVDGNSSYRCDCTPGFTGQRCGEDINECLQSDCVNGECMDGINGFSCVCPVGYTGEKCEEDIDECVNSKCDKGFCLDQIGRYECRCFPGYEGQFCGIDRDDCVESDCVNGTCIDEVDGYACDCLPGFVGRLCDEDFDECAEAPCENGGTCLNLEDGFVCECPRLYSGLHCETNNRLILYALLVLGVLAVSVFAGYSTFVYIKWKEHQWASKFLYEEQILPPEEPFPRGRFFRSRNTQYGGHIILDEGFLSASSRLPNRYGQSVDYYDCRGSPDDARRSTSVSAAVEHVRNWLNGSQGQGSGHQTKSRKASADTECSVKSRKCSEAMWDCETDAPLFVTGRGAQPKAQWDNAQACQYEGGGSANVHVTSSTNFGDLALLRTMNE